MSCKVSVITVCFNAEKDIEKTLRSVLGQSFKSYEYIIKDGNSNDSTNRIIKKYISIFQDMQIDIRHIISEDLGIYDAMNQAVQYCNGEWIIFMNAGDIFYDENVLSDIFAIYKDNDIGVLYGHAFMELTHNRGFIQTYNADIVKKGGSICHQSVLEKRNLLLQNPFNTKLKILADRDHFLQLLNHGVQFRRVNSIVAREDRNGISSINYSQLYKEERIIRVKYNLNYKRKYIYLARIKMFVKKVMPRLEEYVMINKALKRIN